MTAPGHNSAAPERRDRTHPVERLVFFTDAVVAIALTLLILPLMESVSEAPEQGDTAVWLEHHFTQVLSFAMSFLLIAVFWLSHHRLFDPVERATQRLLALDFCWMFTIVVLPVVTALVGAMPTVDDAGHYDRLLVGLYVGTMFCNALLLYLMQVELNRHPRLLANGAQPNRVSEAVTLTLTILFGLAGLVAVLFPQVNLFAMFLLFLTEPLRKWVFARLNRPPAAES